LASGIAAIIILLLICPLECDLFIRC
jgi:hypothetical protein